MFHIRALFILIDIRNILYNYIKISLTREELSLFFWIIYFCIFIIISVLKFRTICINLYFKLHSIYNYSNIKVEKKKRHRFKDATFFFSFFCELFYICNVYLHNLAISVCSLWNNYRSIQQSSSCVVCVW